jgi:hypothetical protein
MIFEALILCGEREVSWLLQSRGELGGGGGGNNWLLQ